MNTTQKTVLAAFAAVMVATLGASPAYAVNLTDNMAVTVVASGTQIDNEGQACTGGATVSKLTAKENPDSIRVDVDARTCTAFGPTDTINVKIYINGVQVKDYTFGAGNSNGHITIFNSIVGGNSVTATATYNGV